MNLASKIEDSNRATSPHISRPSDPIGRFHRPLNRANHVTVSRGQVVPDSSRWSRGRGQVACNHLASRFIGGSLFLIPGEKNGCVASLSQASASGFQIHLWVSFINTRKKTAAWHRYHKPAHLLCTSQRSCTPSTLIIPAETTGRIAPTNQRHKSKVDNVHLLHSYLFPSFG